MIDQAAELRKLALQVVSEAVPAPGPAPRLVVLSGGKGGVGVTTLALSLAVGLARRHRRVVLVDADLYRADVAKLCGLPERGTVVDVLTGRRTLAETLQDGPAGLQILPGAGAPVPRTDSSEIAHRRLLRQITQLGGSADFVLVDAGNGGSETTRRYWQAADVVLLTTTAEALSIMDSYATIKRLHNPAAPAALRLIVNQTADANVAADVHRRLNVSCQQFLACGVGYLGCVPPDAAVAAGVAAAVPFNIATPVSAAACAVELLAVRLAAEFSGRSRRVVADRASDKESREVTEFAQSRQRNSSITA